MSSGSPRWRLFGGLLFGYDSAVINGAVSAIGHEFTVGGGVLGFAVASALLGAAAGAMSAGRFADRFGRLFVMKVAAALFFISAIGAGLAPNLWLLILFRVIGGLGVGVASVIAPAYIAEVSPPRIRGRLGSLQQLAIVFGIFLSLLVDYLLAGLAGGSRGMLWFGLEAWRWMFIAMMVPAVLYGVLALTIPESPRHKCAVGTYRCGPLRQGSVVLADDARRSLCGDICRRERRRHQPRSAGSNAGPRVATRIITLGIEFVLDARYSRAPDRHDLAAADRTLTADAEAHDNRCDAGADRCVR